jgi:hypothetical protein
VASEAATLLIVPFDANVQDMEGLLVQRLALAR